MTGTSWEPGRRGNGCWGQRPRRGASPPRASHQRQSPSVSPVRNTSQARGDEVRLYWCGILRRGVRLKDFVWLDEGLNGRRHGVNVARIVKAVLRVTLTDVL